MAGHADDPLLVFGPRSLAYDFGPSHPLSPRRFGPGIELLRSVGAAPGLAPEPASDTELEWLHAAGYLAAVRRFSADPDGFPEAGIGPGDDPAFAGMHEAAATVAGGSIRALEAILRDGVAVGAFRVPDAKLATRALIAMLTGVTQWFRDGGRLARAEVEAIYAEMALRAVGAG